MRKTVPKLCGSECEGAGTHGKKACELEKGHGGMHWHGGRTNHVYRTY